MQLANLKSQSHLSKFIKVLGANFTEYNDMHRYSIEESEQFWNAILDYFSIEKFGSCKPYKQSNLHEFLPYDWYPNLKLNFAQNLLRFAKTNPNSCALDFFHESGIRYQWTYKQLENEAKIWAYKLKVTLKLRPGDRVCAIMPNCPQTVAFMLGASWVGLTFSSISADFGTSAIVDRITQIEPKVILSVKEYTYAGKKISVIDKLASFIQSIEHVFYTDFLNNSITEDFDKEIPYELVPFNHPLYIMFSSGTTGKPKCIVHGTGGTLINHAKELGLHIDLQANQSIFFFTTCGWMMWNWLVSSLFFGAKIVLYEGQPTYPCAVDFLEIINLAKISIFGTSPKFLKFLEKDQGDKNAIDKYPTLKYILSTGAPLLEEQYTFVKNYFGSNIMLGSISGGTDILGCFMICLAGMDWTKQSIPAGYLHCKALGMDIVALDETNKVVENTPGELVCRKSFPSTPIYFLHDSDFKSYHKSYFEKIPSIWCHGDSITINSQGNIIVHGRSDATLNPSGVRIGTSEIYQQVEKISEVLDSLAIDKVIDGENYIWLFVKLKEKVVLDNGLVAKIKSTIKKETSARHVPSEIYQVADIPYTLSGKKMELLISKWFNTKPITVSPMENHLQALSNPHCLESFREIISP